MRDKHFLLNSWPFFQKHIKQMVVQLQNKASQVYTNEQNEHSQRALRLSRPEQSQPTSRSLNKLTASPTVFAQLHLWFTWILSTGAKRLEEDLPTRPLDCLLEEKQENVEGFIIVEEVPKEAEVPTEELILHLRRLRQTIGAVKFRNLLQSALIGHQVVVRGPKDIVRHILSLFRFLLPKKKFQCLEFVDSYQTPDVCNFIGLDLYAAAPVPSADIIRLDIVPYQEKGALDSIEEKLNYDNYQFLLKSRPEASSKCPTLLTKIDKALADDALTNRVVFLHIISLIEQWTHNADVIREVKKKPGNNDLTNLLQYLGVQDQDDRLIEFWSA